ncbi:type I-B CRISPR-associated protein Cas7/Cst2/DevR [Clostridium sp. D2Q-11]|uniref:Type I-B CRISPR-associated protein Cas7/Cst2/DevR n=1 Tax=Anaeromonas frigoriresistens TaxID=2683708 RepID=A0A942Z7L4_9FIRM|nr:type I-B CRISPR-associated protein Cas7/Cst2/DevR [Anaeromonas frigoriresistens]MBS4537080.1 type I-B CRISPR-associated protein Cas7/Cst2/DevR [Anaeromonas frigoriresistens]
MLNNMKPKGLTLSMIFEAESANYGESVGNVASLKKIARNKGEQYTYISRQAIRYNIVEQLGEDLAEVKAEGSGDKKVIQFDSKSTIKDYPEIDFFGYMKTEKGNQSKIRTAKVRLSNAISLEPFKGDLDFLTNKGLADRLNENMNIAQAEIHHSYYRYTLTVDLEQIGIDEKEDINIGNVEKARRVNKLLDTIAMLYRDIRGRREDLKPIFAIGGVYDVKNPIFHNVVDVIDNKLIVSQIEGILFDNIKNDTKIGLIEGKFDNDEQIKEELNTLTMPELFRHLKNKVNEYYESN